MIVAKKKATTDTKQEDVLNTFRCISDQDFPESKEIGIQTL